MNKKELLENLKEIMGLADKVAEKKMENDRDRIVETATREAKRFKQSLIVADEYGNMVVGTGINILATLSSLVNHLKSELGLSEDLIRNAVDIGLENKKEKNDLEELLDNFKKMMED